MDIGGLRRLCVDRFPDSFTRGGIMTNLEAIVQRINQSGIRAQLWINGSFLTEKLNPEDADIAMIVEAATFASMSPSQRLFFDGFRTNSLFASHKIDNYGQVIDPSRPEGPWMHAYWLRQFGFSRAEEMKGIAQIDVPFVVVP